MNTEHASIFVAGIVVAIFIGFLVKKFRDSKNRPPSTGGTSGRGRHPKDML